LVRRLECVASDAGAEAVSGVEVWLGALSQFTPHHFCEHFNDEAKGTIAEGARLDILTSDDVANPDALHVVIRNVDLEVPDTKG
jgi:hydrogenase nickel incorporation protein HypA/HybF